MIRLGIGVFLNINININVIGFVFFGMILWILVIIEYLIFEL